MNVTKLPDLFASMVRIPDLTYGGILFLRDVMNESNECDLIFHSEPANALSVKQQSAMQVLAVGATFKEAAAAAGVSRSTLYRWIDGDPNFGSIWDDFQAELARSARSRLMGLADSAVGAVAAAVNRGDARVAIAMLRGLGVFKPGGRE
jgi:hypothetical protein